jgi:hypothetical protein
LPATAAEPPPEITRVRLVHSPAICLAPQYLAEDLLRLEGFTQIDYVEVGALAPIAALASGQADFTQDAAPPTVKRLDTGDPLVVLGGITRWRESNPEDTLRFHALRLHEVGMIKSTPQRIVAQGTDWRFWNELKRELKA